ncbi:MAG TPA: hypothetical protein VMZ05_00430 [Spirochaetota bacterium]|nr:hypothetical protein [Spirochaetota bacterium]
MKIMKAILLLFIILGIPLAVSAGSDREAASVASAVDDIYGDRGGTEELKIAISEAVDAGMPSEAVEAFVREAARSERDPGEVAKYIRVASDLFSVGIPEALLFNTLIEGFVKGVGKEEMLRSVGPLRSKFRFASEISEKHTGKRGGGGSDHELLLSALFYTMNMGYAEENVKALSKAAGEKNLSSRAFFNILKISMELSSLGLRPARVSAIMERSIRNGTSIRQMSGYPSFVREGREKGLADNDIYGFLMIKADEVLISEKSSAGTGTESGKSASPSGGKGGSAGGGPSAGGSPGGGK